MKHVFVWTAFDAGTKRRYMKRVTETGSVMAVTSNAPAPYAPATAVMEVINRARKGFSQPVTLESLSRLGISASLAPRTLQALQSLDLINDDGTPTEILDGLRRAPEADFQNRLAAWLNSAYADILQYIDPATADNGAIHDAFRNYNPVGQQTRMVTLFSGLYTAAGVRTGERAAAPRAPRATLQRPRSQSAKQSKTPTPVIHSRTHVSASIPPALAGLLETLPDVRKGWTQERRDKFYQAFGVMLDYCFPIGAQEPFDEDNDSDE